MTAAAIRKATINLPLESFFDSPKLSVSFNVQIVRTAKYIVRLLRLLAGRLSLKIRLVLISTSAIANHDVIIICRSRA